MKLFRASMSLLITLVLSSCSNDDSSEKAVKADGVDYKATIRRTSFGIPHISAADFGSLGFGQGYAFAQDGLCELADQIVKVRSERARYFGAGDADEHIVSDLAYKALLTRQRATESFENLDPEGRAALQGYVAGYNQFLQETGVENLPPDCQDAAWVKPIDEVDMMSYYLDLVSLTGARNFIDFIGSASPPTSTQTKLRFKAPPLKVNKLASNGVAFGKTKTANGRGLLLSNTHLPWEGELKYHEVHLTIPDKLDVIGVTLRGGVGVLIGFNKDVAWTHTTSTSNQFTAYQLKLVEGNPLAYWYDDEVREMTPVDVSIDVKQADGTLQALSRTLYRSHYGPMAMVPGVGAWSQTSALTIRDANEQYFNFWDTFFAIDQVQSVEQFKAVLREKGGVPWNNTMVADKTGNTLYTDSTLVPNLSAAALADFQSKLESDLLTQLLYSQSAVLLDGSDSRFEWVDDPAATVAGIVPFDEAPQLQRDDFVANMNDSHWLPNPAAPLEGYSLLYGPEQSSRSLRTRLGMKMIAEEGGADGLFTLEEIKALLFNNRALAPELLKDDVVARCESQNNVIIAEQTVNLTEACGLLRDWDGRFNNDSVGAPIFRELMGNYSSAEVVAGDTLYQVPFAIDDPVNTPNTLVASTGENDPVLQNLAKAVLRLQKTSLALNQPLEDYQYNQRNAERIAIHGGLGTVEGAFNVIGYASFFTTLIPGMSIAPFVDVVAEQRTGLTTEGYPVNRGASYMLAVEFTEDGPRAEALMSYSQSNDPRSTNYSDQTQLYSQKQWRPVLFDEADIQADPQLSEITVTNAAP